MRNRLAEIRAILCLDRAEMAAYLALSRRRYERYERQEAQPCLETALRISNRLVVPLQRIFYLDDNPLE